VTTLLPLMMASRFLQKKIPALCFDGTAELKISPLMNSLLLQLLWAELALVRNGLNLEVGGSRFVVATKG
jgi:hypothetical protein